MLHLNNTYVYAQYTCRLVWNKNQNSKRVKGFDDGEVNKQSVTKIESIFF
jgi:hypothetical protein